MKNTYDTPRGTGLRNRLLLLCLALCAFCLIGTKVQGQVVSAYTFAQSTTVYSPLVGGTILATATSNTTGVAGGSIDSQNMTIATGSFPFTFTFNGTGYTGCNVNANGYITFGATLPATTLFSPISSTTAYAGAVSAWGGDINSMFNISGVTGDVRWDVVGVAPFREIVIQWTDFRPVATSSTTNVFRMNFQIRLHEAGNLVQVVYGTPQGYLVGATTISGTRQIGLRGATNLDFNNRLNSTAVLFTSSTAGTFNSSTQAFNTVLATPGMPSAGLTYTWTPPAPLCPAASQCNFTFELFDTFGDGWNGATISVRQSGVPVALVTFTSGFSAVVTVPLCPGLPTDLVWTAGTFPSECSYNLKDGGGAILNSFAPGGSPPNGSTFFTFSPVCPACLLPTGLAASAVTGTTATISWNAVAGASSYDYEVRTSGACGSGAAGLVASGSTAATSANIIGLSGNVTYTFCVRADCGVNGQSFFSSGTFTTPCSPYSSSPNLPIPDANAVGVSDVITVSGTSPNVISDLNVRVNIPNHTWIGDLEIRLTSPSGTTVLLWDNQCGSNDGLTVTFDDQGTPVVCAQPTVGIRIPFQALSVLIGEVFDGNWTLNVRDLIGGDIGTLVDWCLDPTLVAPPACDNPLQSSLAITNVTATDVTVSWGSSTGAVLYQWEVRTSGACGSGPVGLVTSGGTFPVVGPTQMETVGGLTPNTSYTFCVRALCSGNNPSFYVSINFTTLPVCPTGQVIIGLPGGTSSYPGNNTCGNGNNCNRRPTEDMTHQLVITCDAVWTISLCSSSPIWDSYLYLTTACCGGTNLAINDDFCSSFGLSQVTATLTAGVYYLVVEGFTGANCGDYTVNITPSAPSAGTITGPGSVACSQINVVYSVVNVPGTFYTWTVPPGALITAGQGTNSITVDFSGTGGTVTVTPTGSCGGTGPTTTRTITVTGGDPPVGVGAENCGPGTMTLSATPGAGGNSINWYSTATTTVVLATGLTYTASFSATTTVYAATVNTFTGCVSTRTPVVATVKPLPNAGFSGLTTACANDGPQTLTPVLGGGTFAGPGVAGNTFSPAVAGPGIHTVTYNVTQFGYAVAPVTYAPVAGSGTAVPLADDQVSGAQPIGFSFDFYGTTYTSFYISSNGFITFTATTASGCCSGQNLPSTLTPNNLITSVWEDWNPAVGGTIEYFTTGPVGSRTLVVNWINVPHFSGGGGALTAQIVLHEGSNLIDIHITSMITDGGNHTQGIENQTGTEATTVPGRNANGLWSATNSSHQFTPGVPGCSNTGSQNVTVLPLPDASFTGLSSPYCTPTASSTLTPTTPGGVFSGPGVTGSVFDPASAGPGMHTITYTVTSNLGPYTVASIPYAAQSTAGGTFVTLSDDAVTAFQPIGFTFNFYGVDYTDFIISSNGFITFNAGTANGCCSGQLLPNPLAPNNLITAVWEDWNPAQGGTISYLTSGPVGSRRLVVSYAGVPHFFNGTPLDAWIVLYEGSNIAEVHITSMITDGGLHTLGIENANGTQATVVPGRNASSTWSVTTPEGWQFRPGCTDSSSQTVKVGPKVNVTCSKAAKPAYNQGWDITFGFGPQSTTVCATASGGTGTLTYAWSGNNITAGASSASATVAPTTAGSHVYTVTVTDAIGCTATCSVTVCAINLACDVQTNNGVGGSGNAGNGQGITHIFVCHVPPGNPNNAMTKCLPIPAVAAHLAQHPNRLGPCVGFPQGCGGGSASCTGNKADEPLASGNGVFHNAYPNPFNNITTITFEWNRTAQVSVDVFDKTGKPVAKLFNGLAEEGLGYSVEFNGQDFPAGVYLYRLSDGEYSQTGKLVLIK